MYPPLKGSDTDSGAPAHLVDEDSGTVEGSTEPAYAPTPDPATPDPNYTPTPDPGSVPPEPAPGDDEEDEEDDSGEGPAR
jgi:hypothetical protein